MFQGAESALHVAALNGKVGCLKLLLQKKADANAKALVCEACGSLTYPIQIQI